MPNVPQQIFIVFFAIFWGTLANAWPRRKPFHWPFIAHGRVACRIALSFALLNVLPVAYFAVMFQILSHNKDSVVMGVIPAFSLFGIYRIWLAVIEFAPSYFYYKECELPTALKDAEPTFDKLHPKTNSWLNLMFGVLYIALATIPPIWVAYF